MSTDAHLHSAFSDSMFRRPGNDFRGQLIGRKRLLFLLILFKKEKEKEKNRLLREWRLQNALNTSDF